jgi:hypothetical protein
VFHDGGSFSLKHAPTGSEPKNKKHEILWQNVGFLSR